MANILDTTRSYLTPVLIDQAATLSGESEGGISKAFNGLVPSMLAGMLDKTADPEAMADMHAALSRFPTEVPEQLGRYLDSGNLAHGDPRDAAGHLLGHVFGSKVPAVIRSVAAFAGVKTDTASMLLGLAGPLLMSVLRRRIDTEGLTVSGLANTLIDEKDAIYAVLPTGMSAILNLKGPKISTPAAPEAATGIDWILPLLLLLALGGGLMFYLKYCG